jgi:hypothetical protein
MRRDLAGNVSRGFMIFSSSSATNMRYWASDLTNSEVVQHHLQAEGPAEVNMISLLPGGMKSTAFGAPSSRHIS